MRFTRNPGLSATTTGTLPSLRTNSTSVAIVASSVDRPRTTSTSCMRWTGLKKCSPATRSEFGVAFASRVTDKAEVFDARMADGPSRSASWRKTSALHVFALDDCFDHQIGAGDWFPLTRRCDVPEEGIARVARQRPLLTASRVRDSIFFIPPATISSLMSFTTTGMPLSATSCAIPAPIVPAPTTATFRTGAGVWSPETHVDGLRARLALEEEFDQVAGGRCEDDPGELVALGGEPGQRQRAANRLRSPAARRAMRGNARRASRSACGPWRERPHGLAACRRAAFRAARGSVERTGRPASRSSMNRSIAASNCSGGAARSTSPALAALFAESVEPSRIIRRACRRPTSRGNRCVPPQPGMSPS